MLIIIPERCHSREGGNLDPRVKPEDDSARVVFNQEGKIKNHPQKRGFTIIEIMVVMSITALMSVLGLAAIMNVNNNVIADQISEGVLSQIRETQNKAFSVAGVGALIPMGWAVKVNSTTDLVTSLYIKPDYTTALVGGDYAGYPYKVDDVTVNGSSVVSSSVWLLYSTPFAGYKEVNGSRVSDPVLAGPGNPCYDSSNYVCSLEPNPPKSLVVNSETGFDVDNKEVKIVISFRGNQRTITVSPNGEANISG